MSPVKEEVRSPANAASRPLSVAARLLAAALLVSASRALARLAVALEPATRPAATDPRYEFHAEAGAPEGALYLDGELIARLPGVSRL